MATPKKTTTFQRLTAYIRPYRGFFILGLVLTVSLAVLNPARTYLVQKVLDEPVAKGDLAGLRLWIVILLGMTIFQTVLQYFQIWITNWIGQTILNQLRQSVFDHILRLRMRFYDTNPIGALQTRVISDIQTLSNVFSEGLVGMAGELLQLFAILGFMFYTEWRLALIILSVLPITIFATYVFKVRVEGAFKRVRKYVSDLNTFIQEHVTGMLVTQIFHQEAREYDKFKETNRKHRDANIETIYYYSIFFPVVELISAIGMGLLVWYGAQQVLDGRLTFGALVAFFMYIQMFFRPIRMLADQFNSLQMGIVSAERIFKVLDAEEFIADNPNGLTALPTDNPSIEFRNVSFAYNETDIILKDVSFQVAPGTTTAIVGATGAGKSSIINILMRMYEIQSGEIRVGGRDAKEYTLETLRKQTGLVMQDVFLFSGSIYDNITLNNPDIPLEKVKEAAKLVGADAFIEQMPGGYHYHVGERGGSLSTGQRQLLSFIRVLVYDPKILLLDEATANIDSETESLIQNAITKLLSGRTSIIIAHRLSTIQKADQIIVMRQGEIIERGNHQSLLAQDGYYKKLYLLQYGYKTETV